MLFEKIENMIKINNKLLLYKYTILILFVISYILYFLSLEKCLDGEEICGNNMRWIYKKLVELIVSCELLSFLFATIVFNYSSKLHLIHLIVIFSLFYFYSHGFFFFDHGFYNFAFFIFLFVLNVILILFLKFIIFLFQIKNKLIINKLLLVCLLFLIYNYPKKQRDLDFH